MKDLLIWHLSFSSFHLRFVLGFSAPYRDKKHTEVLIKGKAGHSVLLNSHLTWTGLIIRWCCWLLGFRRMPEHVRSHLHTHTGKDVNSLNGSFFSRHEASARTLSLSPCVFSCRGASAAKVVIVKVTIVSHIKTVSETGGGGGGNHHLWVDWHLKKNSRRCNQWFVPRRSCCVCVFVKWGEQQASAAFQSSQQWSCQPLHRRAHE